MSHSFAVDLHLTTLEFAGLITALRHYTQNVGNQSACELAEDEMILARYAAQITDTRLLLWKRRRLKETQRNTSLLKRPRYSYRADWLLVSVLTRLLTADWGLYNDPACRQLLNQLHQLHTDAALVAALQRVVTARRIATGELTGIVEANPLS